jgi:hypothetical protein
MSARIGRALGVYWGGIAQAIDVIALISTLGAVGGLPALLNLLTRYARLAGRQLRGLHWFPVRHP